MWCNGYSDQEVICFDEISGADWTHGHVLQLANLNHDAPMLNVKGSSVKGNYHTVIFTTNRHPRDWFRNKYMEPDGRLHWLAFARRVTECRHFPLKRPDGSSNLFKDWKKEAPYEAYFEKINLMEEPHISHDNEAFPRSSMLHYTKYRH